MSHNDLGFDRGDPIYQPCKELKYKVGQKVVINTYVLDRDFFGDTEHPSFYEVGKVTALPHEFGGNWYTVDFPSYEGALLTAGELYDGTDYFIPAEEEIIPYNPLPLTEAGGPEITVPVTIAGNTRTFETGATRDTDVGKHDYEGYLSPKVLKRFGAYMTKNRVQSDGNVRDSDNWQKGIPRDQYMKSLLRHAIDAWDEHREPVPTMEALEEALCGVIFNAMGYLHEELKRGG